MGLFNSNKKVYVVKYLGGHPEILKEGAANLILEPDKVIISIPFKGKYELAYNEITMEQQTHEQISKNITLGRILLVGVFALAWKKKSVDRTGYITIRYMDKDIGEVEIILKHDKPGEVLSNFLAFKKKVAAIV